MKCPVCSATLSGDYDLDPAWLQNWQAHVATCQLTVLLRIAEALERLDKNGIAVKP